MHPMKRTARLTGLLYLLVALAGPFILIYVPGKLFVPGDAAATAGNILAHESLFEAHILVSLFSELCFIGVALGLYRLLRDEGVELAVLMVVLVLVDAPLAFLRVANDVATLTFVRGADLLAAFDEPQRDALATLFANAQNQGLLRVSHFFWGLWLLPLGWLVARSEHFPRLLGGWLFVNGLAYVAIGATGVALPQRLDLVSTVATPVLFGEVALMLWLLIRGVREPPSDPLPTA